MKAIKIAVQVFAAVLTVLFVALVAASMFLAPATPLASTPVAHLAAPVPYQEGTGNIVPAAVAAALTGFVGFWITQGAKSATDFLSRFWWAKWMSLNPLATFLTGTIVTGLLFFANLGLAQLPNSFASFYPFLWQLILALLSAYAPHLTMLQLSGASSPIKSGKD